MTSGRRKKHRVVISASAERDLEEAFSYIARDNPQAARRWLEGMRRKVKSLESMPSRGAFISESSELRRAYRQLVYGRYRIIYRLEERAIMIMRVLHAARILEIPDTRSE